MTAAAALVATAAVAPPASGEGPLSLDDLKVTTLGPSGPTALRVDLVILGEGYVKADFGPRGRWEVDASRLVKNFFEKVPFKAQRGLFNVHLVEVVSLDSGADDGPDKDVKRTAFNCCYGTRGIQRLLVARDEKAIARAAANAPAADIILVLVNDPRSGGSGGSTEAGIPSPVCSVEATAFLTAIHELAHSFAGLGDEYVDDSVASSYPLPASGDLPQPNLTLARLVDTGSREALLRTLKWGRYLRAPNAATEVGKGYYEGGYYRAKGIYRPAAMCVMQDESGGGRFCYVCLDEMTRAIYRTCRRGPTGAFAGIALKDAPRDGALAAAIAAYEEGRFAKVVAELKRLEKQQDKLGSVERSWLEGLRHALETSLTDGLEAMDGFLRANDRRAALEFAGLFEAAFKGTEWEKRVQEKRKEIK